MLKNGLFPNQLTVGTKNNLLMSTSCIHLSGISVWNGEYLNSSHLISINTTHLKSELHILTAHELSIILLSVASNIFNNRLLALDIFIDA